MNMPVNLNNVKLNQYFALREFACHCCGRVMVYVPLLTKLTQLRLSVNKPVYLDCVYRCPEHNEEVGGVDDSLHLIACAADVNAVGIGVTTLEKEAKRLGFTEVIAYPEKNFVHMGIDDLVMKELYLSLLHKK